MAAAKASRTSQASPNWLAVAGVLVVVAVPLGKWACDLNAAVVSLAQQAADARDDREELRNELRVERGRVNGVERRISEITPTEGGQ